MNAVSHIKCPNCGTFNTNKDFCESCNSLISHQKKRVARAALIHEKEVQEVKEELEKVSVSQRLMKHPFFLVKILGWCIQSIWFVLNIVGGLIAWFIAMVAAG